jgi:hypothetical protein
VGYHFCYHNTKLYPTSFSNANAGVVEVSWQLRSQVEWNEVKWDVFFVVGFSLSYGRRSVDHFILVSGSSLGVHDQILSLSFLKWQFISFSSYTAPSLMRGRVCNLQCNRWLVRSLRTNNHTLPSHLRLCSLFVASYDSQGLRWRYCNPPPHGVQYCLISSFLETTWFTNSLFTLSTTLNLSPVTVGRLGTVTFPYFQISKICFMRSLWCMCVFVYLFFMVKKTTHN